MSQIQKQGKYLVRGIPKNLDAVIRKKAQQQKKSLNSLLLELISRGVGLEVEPKMHHDLDFLIGTMTSEEAKEMETQTNRQRKIHPKDWK